MQHPQSKDNTFKGLQRDYKVTFLVDKLLSYWLNFAEGVNHKQNDQTLMWALKAIRIEDEHKQNFKTKFEMKIKVKMVKRNRSLLEPRIWTSNLTARNSRETKILNALIKPPSRIKSNLASIIKKILLCVEGQIISKCFNLKTIDNKIIAKGQGQHSEH